MEQPAIGTITTTRRPSPAWRAAREFSLLAIVLALFAASAFIVPTLAPVATTDDWGYTRLVQILYREGELTVFPVIAATAVFQVFWGWLWAHLLGMTLGVMRVSTLVMVGLGGLALYGLLRQLGVNAGRSALGVATYLFNPLTFILAYTFMTDPHFASLLIAATCCYQRGLRDDRLAPLATLAGSTIAGCAFLTRQQGALIPLAVVLFLVFSGRLYPNRRGVRDVLLSVAVPAATTVAYYVWLRIANEVPEVQQGFFAEARESGVAGTWRLVRHLTFIELMYLGFFLLPLAAAALPAARSLVASLTTRGWLLFSAALAILAGGLGVYQSSGKRMPYIAQFVGSGGLGPPDVRGSRPRLLDAAMRDWITLVCAIAAVVVLLILGRAVSRRERRGGPAAGLVAMIACWQVIGILPPSFHYQNRGYSLDRYLLPILPLAICLVLHALRDIRIRTALGWLVVAGYAVYAVAGARDYLVYMDAVWDLAREANRSGVANDRLDAGAAWDGYRLYTYALDNDITRARTRDGPWWVYFYGKPTDSSWVVSGAPIRGYYVIWIREYSSWLYDKPTRLYLLRRAGVPGPP